ncbi:hypothetical protein [Aquimarina brevivitae]|uniref:Uncharacterized protein n=1 Tax=Aquimarina brevivitae TaxID=323412 RepID=A0A4Q7PHC0_9FLAO|nr:hypothetical protein [Aquimarina brevivitae]RZS99547.1 hypothetical protein EV197_0769 [Aquimarina brevivitae]
MHSFKKSIVLITLIALIIVSLCFFYCNVPKSELSKTINPGANVISINYTYWWNQTGPFIGNCGEKYGLVVLGTITDLQHSIQKKNYHFKKGLIRIDSVLYDQKNLLQVKNISSLSSDCFRDVKAKEGDLVMVFCYLYQKKLSIPGGKSIIKISDFKDPLVISIAKYIEADQNPLIILEDLELWTKEGLGDDLQQILNCKKMFN